MGTDNSVVLSTAEYMMLGQYMLVLMSNTVLKLFSKLSKFKYLEMFLRKMAKDVFMMKRTVSAMSAASNKRLALKWSQRQEEDLVIASTEAKSKRERSVVRAGAARNI